MTTHTTPLFALFHNGKQVSKSHSTIDAARAEAFEHGAVIDCAADMPGEIYGRVLANGYEVREVADAGT